MCIALRVGSFHLNLFIRFVYFPCNYILLIIIIIHHLIVIEFVHCFRGTILALYCQHLFRKNLVFVEYKTKIPFVA